MIWSCIVGPTAAGKSSLALQMAEARGLAIISADSRQIYRSFDVGTAKPTAAEQARVPHYGIDVVAPEVRYSAHAWATDAQEWAQRAEVAGTPPILVGGTGLYIRALVEPLAPVPTLDPDRRARLGAWLDQQPWSTLQQWCQRLDPVRAHLGRTQLLRAIETALLAGVRQSDSFVAPLSADHRTPTHPARYLVVDPGEVLSARIAGRVHAMVEAGFVGEVQALRERVPAEAPAWKASGYTVMREAIEGHRALNEAIERVIIETRQYAKRQRTWYRHQLPAAQVTWLDPLAPDALDRALVWLDSGRTHT